MARRSTKPWDLRIMCAIWRDAEFRELGVMAQWLCFRSIAQLGIDRSSGGLQYAAADFGLDPIEFEGLARKLVRLGVYTWVDDDHVEVHPYKDLIFPVPVKWRLPIPQGVRQLVLDRDGHKCRHCGTTDRLEMDHIHPWSLGGSDDESNLQTLCRSCNWRKGATV